MGNKYTDSYKERLEFDKRLKYLNSLIDKDKDFNFDMTIEDWELEGISNLSNDDKLNNTDTLENIECQDKITNGKEFNGWSTL